MSTTFKFFRLYKFAPVAFLCSAPLINPVTDFNKNNVKPIDVVRVQKQPITVLHFQRSLNSPNSSKVVWDKENFTKVLDQVGDLPLVILSINGRKRTGKSTALNHILRLFDHYYGSTDSNPSKAENPPEKSQSPTRSKVIPKAPLDLLAPLGKSGFPVGNSLDVVTKGILIWPEPFFLSYKTSQGKEVKFAVLLMDTQGLHDNETTEQENAVLFSFSSFCSSVMIYNVKDMDDDSLQHLKAFITYSKGLQKGGRTPKKFIILQRDFPKPKSFAFGLHTASIPKDQGTNYWHHILGTDVRGQNEPTSMSSENLALRNELKKTFGAIEIFLLPPPGNTFLYDPADAVATRHPEYMGHLTYLTNFVQYVSSIRCLAPKSRKKGVAPHDQVMTGHLLKEKFLLTWAGLKETSEFDPLKTLAQYYITDKIHMFTKGAIKRAKEIDRVLGQWDKEEPYGVRPEDCQKRIKRKILPFQAKLLAECAKLEVGEVEEDKIKYKIESAFTTLINQIEEVNEALWEKNKGNRQRDAFPAGLLTASGGLGTAAGAGLAAVSVAAAPIVCGVGAVVGTAGLVGYGVRAIWTSWKKKDDIPGKKPATALEIFYNQLSRE